MANWPLCPIICLYKRIVYKPSPQIPDIILCYKLCGFKCINIALTYTFSGNWLRLVDVRTD